MYNVLKLTVVLPECKELTAVLVFFHKTLKTSTNTHTKLLVAQLFSYLAIT